MKTQQEIEAELKPIGEALVKSFKEQLINGKYPTGPQCYEGDPVPRGDDGKRTLRDEPLGVHIPPALTEAQRETRRQNGRNRNANIRAKRQRDDMAKLSIEIYPEGKCDQ